MRILLTVAYDGTDYNGWQIQKGDAENNTIEYMLNSALTELLGVGVRVSGASRTDSGVHALCNLAVFDCDSRIPAEKFSYALNQRLPEDIRVRRSVEVPGDFHPRYVPTVKTYEYTIWNDTFSLPVKSRYSLHCYQRLDVEAMNRAAGLFVGEHDFAAFSSAGSQVKTTVRRVTKADVFLKPFNKGLVKNAGEIVIRVSGTGFLYNMVRIMAGTLIEIGKGAREEGSIVKALETGDRKNAGATAPAKGLCLVDYEFDPAYDPFASDVSFIS